MHILLMADDVAKFSVDKDTTRAIMEYGYQRGARWTVANKTALAWQNGSLQVHSREVESLQAGVDTGWISLAAANWRVVTDFDLVLLRNDPPVDLSYLRMCQLLELVESYVPVANPPGALIRHNEKISALRFSEYMPDTQLYYYDNRHGTFVHKISHGVYKSLDSLGGEGVAIIPDARDARLDLQRDLTRGPDKLSDADYLMAQQWIEGVERGDKRVILIDGAFAGVVLRVPRDGEFRGNIHMGGQTVATSLTEAEAAIVHRVGAWLRAENIALCGLDLVAGFLTEINITSPTGFREIERLTQDRPTAAFWQYLEQRVRFG